MNRSIQSIVSFDLDGTLVPRLSTGQYLADRLGHGAVLRELESDYDHGLSSAQAVAEAEASYYAGRSLKDVCELLSGLPTIGGMADVVAELRRRSVAPVINTLAWSFIAADVRDRFGFFASSGVDMHCDERGTLSGIVVRHFDEKDKVTYINDLCQSLGVPTSRVVAVGDARSDIRLFSVVKTSIALNATPEARAAATHILDSDWLPEILPLIPSFG